MPDEKGVTPVVHLEIPRLSALARHALPRVVEGTLIPLALFLVMLRLVGTRGAVASGLAWSLLAIGVRLLLRRPVPGLLLLGAVTLTLRATFALVTGSTFVYFLQPSLATAGIACAFLVSVAVRKPLAEVLAHDFCPFPPEFIANQHVRKVFVRITLLWAVTQLASASISVWLLVSQSTATFLLARTALSMTLTPIAVAASALLFFRTMRRHGIPVRFAPRSVAA